MSLFDCKERAIDWAKSRYRSRTQRHRSEPVRIYKIDTMVLSEALIFKADDLCRRLEITLNRDVAHEYLIALRIPAAAALYLTIDIEALVNDGQSAPSKSLFRPLLMYNRGRS